MRIHPNAKKRFLNDETPLHEALGNILGRLEVCDEDPPRVWMVGMDSAGRLYELVAVHEKRGDLLIHAMLARRHFLREVLQ